MIFSKQKENLSHLPDRELLEMQVELLKKSNSNTDSIVSHLIFYTLMIILGIVIAIFNAI